MGDLTDDALYEELDAIDEPIDILVNNAGRSGITVNTLSPGMIPWSKTTEEGEAVRARTADLTPVGRNGTPEDFVTAVVFLSSEGSGFVNGANIVVDGGWSIW